MQLGGGAAVVTGAAAGIGLALCRRLATEGMSIAVADRDADKLDDVARILRADGAPSVVVRGVDVSDRAQMESFAADVHDGLGPVTLLCNNAGVGGPLSERAWEIPSAEWTRVIGTNFLGVANGIAAFVPAMVAAGNPGQVVNMASELGLVPSSGTVCYSASKHAVVALSEALSLQLQQAQVPITVTVVCPGPVATDMVARERAHIAQRGGHAPTREEVAATASGQDFVRLSPEAVAEATLAGARAGKLYVLTHESTVGRLDDYHRGVRDQVANPA